MFVEKNAVGLTQRIKCERLSKYYSLFVLKHKLKSSPLKKNAHVEMSIVGKCNILFWRCCITDLEFLDFILYILAFVSIGHPGL